MNCEYILNMKNTSSALGKNNSLILAAVALAGFVLASTETKAQLITYIGSETGLPGNGYSVQNWSNPGVAKAYDIGGTEKYGTAGYVQIRPTLNSSPTDVSQSVLSGNTFGISESSNPSLLLQPSFLSSLTGNAGSLVNFNGYGVYRGPDGSTLYRQGALSVSVNNGPFNSPAGANASYFGIAMSFSVNSTTNFRLGLAVDSVGGSDYAPNYISIGGVFSDALTRDGNADMVFFDIKPLTGSENLDVALWQNVGTQPGGAVAALSLVTFDVIPEPSTGMLLFAGLGCLAVFSRRRRA